MAVLPGIFSHTPFRLHRQLNHYNLQENVPQATLNPKTLSFAGVLIEVHMLDREAVSEGVANCGNGSFSKPKP